MSVLFVFQFEYSMFLGLHLNKLEHILLGGSLSDEDGTD
jgi:hypothetical protein